MSAITAANESPSLPAMTAGGMSPAMAIMLDERLFERAKQIATYLSKAEGFVPPHLIGKPESCFAVVTRALTWKLDPFAVAQSTYQTPGGKVGYEGKLCAAIMENSGRLAGGLEYEEIGDWSRVQGKFEIATSQKGNQYAKPAWKPSDEAGLGVVVRAQVKGEQKKREMKLLLVQAFPRNSTLWALDPLTQLKYLANRRFASLAVPGLMMGVPFDREDEDAAMQARDVTPAETAPARPTREQYRQPAAPVVDVPVEEEVEDEPDPLALVDEHGEIVREFKSASDWLLFFRDVLRKAGNKLAAWEGNESQFDRIKEMVEAGDEVLAEIYAEHFPQAEANTGGDADAAPEPSEWDDELAELKRVGLTCQNFGQWTAFLEDYAGRITAMQAGSEPHKVAWIEFAKARMAEFQAKPKGSAK